MINSYPASDGFGSGINITQAGYVFLFHRPVAKVLVRNSGANDMLVGINETITDAADNGPDNPNSMLRRSLQEISVAVARTRGILIPPNTEQIIEGVIDNVNGRRQIVGIWAISENDGEVTTLTGGVTGY